MTTNTAARTGKQKLLAVLLCLVAGYLDGYGLLILGTYVSFMSGNSTFASVRLGQGQFRAALPSATAILLFVLGGILGTLLVRSQGKHPHRLSFALVGLLLVLVSVLEGAQNPHHTAAIALLSLSAGTLNPVLSKVGAESVSLTFMTGNLNRIGGHLASAIRREPLVDAQTPNESHLTRVRVEVNIWLSFVTGAILASMLVSYLRTWVFLPPLVTMFGLAIFYQTD